MDKGSIQRRPGLPGVLIAAPMSGSGKTLFTTGLIAALKGMGRRVISFKCGPDYIDPMYHTRALGIPCRNLDTWFTGEEKTRELFLEDRSEDTIRIAEGVMGLYDGAAGTEKEGSSYDLARVTGLPVILVVNCKGMGRSVTAMIKGFKAMDKAGLIKAVFLNRITEAVYYRLKPLIEEETGLKCIGFLHDDKKLCIKGRHLGLVIPEDNLNTELITAAKEAVTEALDWDCFFSILEMSSAGIYDEKNAIEKAMETADPKDEEQDDRLRNHKGRTGGPILAVARDAAFCFMYEDNLRELKKAGAELCFFSPLEDDKLPEGISGLLLSGGYPEIYAERLSENRRMCEDIRKKISEGLPTVAECGGFMYLQEYIRTADGYSFPMVGALPGTSEDTGHPVRFGYVVVKEKTPCFLKENISLKGHEFHYYDSTENGSSCLMCKPVTGKSWEGITAAENLWAGYPHIYYPAEPLFAEAFVEKMRKYDENREEQK